MSWSGLSSNQMVSFTDAQGGGFSLNSGQSHVTSNQLMTKSDATTKYNLDASNLSGYASNQLVPKSAWVSGASVYSFNVVGSFFSSSEVWENTSQTPFTIYTNSATLGIGVKMWYDSALTSPVNNVEDQWFYHSSIGAFRINETTTAIEFIVPTNTTSTVSYLINHNLYNSGGAYSGSYSYYVDSFSDTSGSLDEYSKTEIYGYTDIAHGTASGLIALDGTIRITVNGNFNIGADYMVEIDYQTFGNGSYSYAQYSDYYVSNFSVTFWIDLTKLQYLDADSEISINVTYYVPGTEFP